MARVMHFEICADNPERAAKFYTDALGWKVEKWDGPVEYWLVVTGPDTAPGINGGIMRRPEPGLNTVNTVVVDSVDDVVARIVKSGGKVVAPKMPVPGIGFMAYCEDTEGNRFSVMKPDMSAS
jgi:uncharacterized protein